MKHFIACLLMLIVFPGATNAQLSFHTLIFKADASFNPDKLKLGLTAGLRSDQLQLRNIFKQENIFSLRCYTEAKNMKAIRTLLSDQSSVLWIENDIAIASRNTPNDPYFDKQWHLTKIAATDSWNITQGGLTPNGDTIVVAVLDDGFYTLHEDLSENLWYNYAEIPGDGIDNDQNGYIDDFKGVNMSTKNDMHSVKEHGTSVAGIIGARGDNDLGGSGVNWQVKLLLISEANSLSNVLEAYQYVLDMRKLYNETNGSQGAYIVATNFSAGIDQVFPEDNPVFTQWCKLYDALGAEGILSINATTNSNTDIDMEGDMPGTCPSAYLMVVTNSDQNDNKVSDAGYGETFVDISAPGQEIFTTSLNNAYKGFNGTSSAAPQLTGTVALMYAAPCKTFADLAKENPESMANSLRTMLMTGVDIIPSLAGKLSSGGRLNTFKAMEKMRDFCEGSLGELTFESVFPNPAHDKLSVFYETENYSTHWLELHNALGQLVFIQPFNPDFFGKKQLQVDLSGLSFPTGIYMLSIRNDKKIITQKILLY